MTTLAQTHDEQPANLDPLAEDWHQRLISIGGELGELEMALARIAEIATWGPEQHAASRARAEAAERDFVAWSHRIVRR
jgi:hypothetical protein